MKRPKIELDLSSVRHMINAAEPVTVQAIDHFMRVFGPYGMSREAIYPTYGLAEHVVFVCSGGSQIVNVNRKLLQEDRVVSILSEEECKENDEGDNVAEMVGCGYPFRGKDVDLRIVDDESCEQLEEDHVGEIWIHSPSKAQGYWNLEEQTLNEFHAQLQNENNNEENSTKEEDDDHPGYLRTGDLGFLHNDELFICGRIKDLIIVRGTNHYPQVSFFFYFYHIFHNFVCRT